jgi:serine acetyltransferase
MKNTFDKMLHRLARLILSPERYARYIGVKIGHGCLISTRHFPSEAYLITIGNNVRIAHGVKFFTHGGLYPFRKRMESNLDIFGKIVIGDNVYIGDSAFILPGVTVGSWSLVAAGSIVTKSVPSGVLVAGNPARIVGKLDGFLSKAKESSMGTKGMSYDEKKHFLLSAGEEKFVVKPLIASVSVMLLCWWYI